MGLCHTFRHLLRGILLITLLAACTGRAADVYYLKKLVIADTEAKAAKAPADDGGDAPVVVHDVPVLTGPEFAAVAQQFIGKPIDTQLLNGLINAITEFSRAHDRLVPQVLIPNKQNISEGTLRLAVLVGRYNQLIFRGNHFFSQKLLEQKLGIKPGDEIRQSVLEEAVNWANANPFREMKVFINPLAAQPGKADMIVTVRDVRPVRFALGYNNNGIPILGRNQYNASVQFGNLWGLDHQGSYQFITTDNIRRYQAHVLSYSAPLPWHHYLEFNASYAEVHPGLIADVLDQTGESAAANLRYRIPLSSGDHAAEFFFGADFKESNNNLAYGGYDVSAAKLDVFQGVVGINAVRKDKHGAWSFGGSLNLSPGDVNSRNTDAAYQPGYHNGVFHVGRLGARARYATGTVSIQRLLKLPKEWDLFSRVVGQYSTSNLVADEQLTIGGAGTVRGTRPNAYSGENGFVFNNDLETPTWKHTFSFLPKKANTVSTRFTLFYDAAQVFYKHHYPLVNQTGQQVGWDDDFLRPLASAGVGVRMSIAENFSLSFDYGWQLTRLKAPADQPGYGHVKVVLAF